MICCTSRAFTNIWSYFRWRAVEPNTQPDKRDAEAFCKHCRWVFECWSLNQALHAAANDLTKTTFRLDNNFKNSGPGQFLKHYLDTSGPYSVLQIAKLHDNPVMGTATNPLENLSIGFFLRPGDPWLDSNEKGRLRRIRRELDCFYSAYIKDARNKIISHKDRDTFRDGSFFCSIPEDKSKKYMCKLGKMAEGIWKNWDCSGQQCFDFSSNGQLYQRCVSIAQETVKCIQDGYTTGISAHPSP